MTWYYADAGRQVGPVEESALDELVRQGVVRDETLVWKEGMAAWQPHGAVRGARAAAPMPAASYSPPAYQPANQPAYQSAGASAAPAADTRFCSECGRPHPASEMVTIGAATVCAQCKPLFMQRMREGGQAIGVRHYAGFWIRFLARLIDFVLLGIVGFIIRIPLTLMMGGAAVGIGNTRDPAAALSVLPAIMALAGISFLIQLAISVAYEGYFVSTRGGTLGKLALGLKIIRADGSPVSLGLAIGRYFAQMLSSIILFIGYIMAGFDPEKRALHDRICETRVIYSK